MAPVTMAQQLSRVVRGGADALSAMRLALDPRFAGDVITFDAELAAGTFRLCAVTECLRHGSSNSLCRTHLDRWRRRGQQQLEQFLAEPGPPTNPEQILLDGLPDQLRIEIALALQLSGRCRGTAVGSVLGSATRGLLAPASTRLAAWRAAEQPADRARNLRKTGQKVRGTLRSISTTLEQFLHPPSAADEFERLPVMGLAAGPNGVVRFDTIPQPWLRNQIKRFLRWRISTGKSYHQINRDSAALQRLVDAFTAQAGPDAGPEQFSRATIESYLALLVEEGLGPASRGYDLSSVKTFLQTVRQQEWPPALPRSADVFPGDRPRRPEAAPRSLPEFVMAQIEDPAAQAKLAQPYRLILQLLIRTGLRINDALRVEVDCVVRDAQQAPYLRYYNHKMRREAFVPIDDELAAAIRAQQDAVLAQWPDATYLTPAPNSRDGRKARNTTGGSFGAITAWQEACGLHDELGRPFRFTAHQLRHTYGTRLINADVPQEVVRRLLDHESPEMTARYARLKDDTIRWHWERARKINIQGETIILDANTPLSDAAWMKENLGRATMALPNGYRGLPLQQTCPHANACLTCPMFITTPDFLAEHLAQLRTTKDLIITAQTKGNTRLAEMNQRVATNLENIIDTIQAPDSAEADDAS
ncbi:site-specific recombinase XerD [Kribbella orskensis]|uniref:Site-specific recombinase XerD n=1 Tax=Kribbella orskensis TaxID=2512216 RepID=A0ABY2B7F5_9ACTN|nr:MULTISPECIES: tyrosine-type recombinase/integrase [Kribbella]TCN29280.1 site-specific recombinase XerD [Kribbella sp. VKM Ac-2500]TCO09535.1 site-specific recombinase XerD [Kribbella orskensis]